MYDGDASTFGETLEGPNQWAELEFFGRDKNFQGFTLVLYNLEVPNTDDTIVKFMVRRMEGSEIYLISSTGEAKLCGTLEELDLSDFTASGQTYTIPCQGWARAIKVVCGNGTAPWYYGGTIAKSIVIAESWATFLLDSGKYQNSFLLSLFS